MKRGALPLNALRAFEATGRLGRMTLAAEELGVSHGAVSRQVRALEATLGTPLFEGPRNRLALTEAGRALLPALTEALDGVETAVNRVTAPKRRMLDVSCLGTLTMRWLIPRLYDFQTRHPRVEVRLTSDHGPVEFGPRGPDLAIRVGRGPWPGASAAPLFIDRTGPVLSPALMPREGLGEPRALAGLPLLHTGTRPAAWSEWCALAKIDIPLEGRTYEHFYFMLEAATAGLGVAIAPDIMVRDDLSAGRLVAPFGFVPSGLTYVALTPETPSTDAAIFRDWLLTVAE